MERWEYHVIHLNVEGPAGPADASAGAAARPAQPAPAPAPAPVTKPEQVFSKEYLEKEFPGFYGSGGGQGSSPDHPAQQLRRFLNLQGREGWQLMGIYPVGQLLMMIFRRPLALAKPAIAAAPPAAAAAPAEPPAPPAEQGALERILERLAALERRLDGGESQAPSAAAAAAATAPLPLDLEPLQALQDGEILPPERWQGLEGHGRLSSAEAARALGFRSAASLLNLAARNGYRPGLIKRGAEGRVAIYVGSERNDHGGRDRRLWVVLNPAQG